MTQDKFLLATQDDQFFEHIVEFRRELVDFILGLWANKTALAPSFAIRLRQVLSAYNGELGRRLKGDPGSPEYFEHITINQLMALLLTSKHIERMRALKVSSQRQTKEDRRVTRFLIAALDDFSTGIDELEQRFPKPDLSDLPRKIWFSFWDVTAAECRHDAASIRERFALIRDAA